MSKLPTLPKPRNLYERERTFSSITGESRTKQSFKDEANINTIVRRFNKTGLLPVRNGQPFYGDFSNSQEFQDAQNQILQVKEIFGNLSAADRATFDNDPGKLIDWLSDSANHAEAVEMGLLPKEALKQPEPTPEPPAEPPAEPTPAPPSEPAGA